MFGMNQTLDTNEKTLTWVDRTYRTERGLRKFLATLNPAQLQEAEILVDDETFVVFYPVEVPAQKANSPFHFDLTLENQPLQVREQELIKTNAAQDEACARRQTEREVAFNILLAGVRL